MIENSNDGWPLLQGEPPTNNARKKKKGKSINVHRFELKKQIMLQQFKFLSIKN